MINELNFPVVLENGREIAYGGDQDWFPQKFQQNAGCASTTGANLAAYYAKNDPKCARFYRGDTGRFLKTEYLDCMQELYRYMTPGFMGFPLVNRFARKFVQFAGEHGGVSVRPHILCREDRPGERIRFVKQAIGGGNPVALLILRHRAPELEEDNGLDRGCRRGQRDLFRLRQTRHSSHERCFRAPQRKCFAHGVVFVLK